MMRLSWPGRCGPGRGGRAQDSSRVGRIEVDAERPARLACEGEGCLGLPDRPLVPADPGNCLSDYTPFLNKNALKGARIAVPPFLANRAQVMNYAILVLQDNGAARIDHKADVKK